MERRHSAFRFLARGNIQLLWVVSLFIALQYLTDVLDGAVGRYRNTGLARWGYYMDHFLDYIFLASIIVGYALLMPEGVWYWLGLLALAGAFMVNAFLAFGATNEFRISFLAVGPTEIRLCFIILNALIVFFGTGFAVALLPLASFLLAGALVTIVWHTQRVLWRKDMEQKRQGQ